MSLLPVGTPLYGYCGGYFGRDSYGLKRIEAVGYDWVVVREDDNALFASSSTIHDDLAPYATEAAKLEMERS